MLHASITSAQISFESNQPPKSLTKPHSTDPFIDRIVIQAKLTASDVTGIASSIGIEAEDLLGTVFNNFRSGLGEPSLGYQPQKKTIPRFRTAQKKIGKEATLGVGVRYKKGAGFWLRLEFNPAHCAMEDIDQIEAEIDGLCCEAIPFDLFLRQARATCLHVTVDVFGVQLADLLPRFVGTTRSVRALAKAKRSVWTPPSGCMESLAYRKQSKRPSFDLILYDKNAELRDRGHELPSSAPPCTRIERKFSRLRQKLSRLDSFGNCFAGIELVDLNTAVALCCDHQWLLFVDSQRVRGIDEALYFVPPSLRLKYRTRLENAQSATYWRPKAIWTRWKPYFEQHAIGGWIARSKLAQ